ncbi:MAG: MarR family transcriptional regulator [Anaerolineales bacterium]
MTEADVTTRLEKLLETFMRRSMHNFILTAKERGLSMTQMGALFAIHRKGACGVTDIGDHLGITAAATSQMLNRLVEQNLIERAEDPADRRLKRIVLTAAGTQTLQESIRARQNWIHRLTATLTPEEQEHVSASLQLLLEKAGQLDASAGSN